jgi:hypothetical protein
MTTSYLLQLSPLEIHWLADSLGIPHLFLLDDPVRHIPGSQLAFELKKGMETLESRGLISRASSVWQVDRLSAAVIKWLGSADSALLMDLHIRDGLSRRSQVFTQDDASMQVTLEDGKYHFLFVPRSKVLSDHLLNLFGASFSGPKSSAIKYMLSQPATILHTSWSNATLAANMLKVTQLKQKEIKPLLMWAESLQWIVTLSRIQLEGEKNGNQEQTILCGNKQGTWSGSVGANTEEKVTIASIDEVQTRALIESLL